VKAWIWFIRLFGFRRAFRYWREGRKRGWMTSEQADEFLNEWIILNEWIRREGNASE